MTADTVGGGGSPTGRALTLACCLALVLAGLVRLTGLAPYAAERLPSAVAGTLAAGLAALACGRLAGPVAAGWGGLVVGLSPIHAIESRVPGTQPLLVLLVLLALLLALELESRPSTTLGVAAGVLLGILAACGTSAFAAVALVLLVWLAWGPDGRVRVAPAAAAVAVLAALALAGVARSPFDIGPVPDDMPVTTASSVLRCSGASFTRVAGLEYQLVVPQAREALPLTLLLLALMARGASRLAPRPRAALAAGALAPFALGAVLALSSGRVQPMQAARVIAALPFTAALTAVGLASLRAVAAWAAGAIVAGALALGLWLTFAG